MQIGLILHDRSHIFPCGTISNFVEHINGLTDLPVLPWHFSPVSYCSLLSAWLLPQQAPMWGTMQARSPQVARLACGSLPRMLATVLAKILIAPLNLWAEAVEETV